MTRPPRMHIAAGLTATRVCVGLLLGLLMFHASPTLAAMVPSTAFNHQYNGNTGPNANGYTHNAGAEATWMPTSDSDILTYQGLIAEGGYWQSDDWVVGPNPISNANGWTIEFRIRVGTDADDDPVGGAFNVFAKDVNGNSSQGRRFQVTVGTDFTSVASRGLVVDSSDNTDGFHVYRFGQNPSSNVGSLWRDGVLLFTGATRSSNDSSGLLAQLWWGDGSSGTGGPTIEVDYVRWDNGGLFEPVPEPSAFALTTLGLISWCGGLLRARRTTRRSRSTKDENGLGV